VRVGQFRSVEVQFKVRLMSGQDQYKVMSDQLRSKSSQEKSEQIRPRSGQDLIRKGHVKGRTGQDMLDLVMTCYVRPGQA